MALSETGRQAIWITSLLCELGIDIKTVPIYGDNQGSIFIGSNPVQEHCSKHIDICYHYIQQLVEDKKIDLYFIPSVDNLVDLFTRNLLPIAKFLKFRDLLGLEFYSS